MATCQMTCMWVIISYLLSLCRLHSFCFQIPFVLRRLWANYCEEVVCVWHSPLFYVPAVTRSNWSLCKNTADTFWGFTARMLVGMHTCMHAHTDAVHNSSLVCAQSASCSQVLTFPECLHSTCELVLPWCQSPSVYTARQLSCRDDKVADARTHAASVSQVVFMSVDKHSLNRGIKPSWDLGLREQKGKETLKPAEKL